MTDPIVLKDPVEHGTHCSGLGCSDFPGAKNHTHCQECIVGMHINPYELEPINVLSVLEPFLTLPEEIPDD
jgi:hypothetical protein